MIVYFTPLTSMFQQTVSLKTCNPDTRLKMCFLVLLDVLEAVIIVIIQKDRLKEGQAGAAICPLQKRASIITCTENRLKITAMPKYCC